MVAVPAVVRVVSGHPQGKSDAQPAMVRMCLVLSILASGMLASW